MGKPSLRQLEAFLSDLCSIFCQEREEERPRAHLALDQEYEEETEDEEEEPDAFTVNLTNLVGMGFIREEAEFALRASFNHRAWPWTTWSQEFLRLRFPPRKTT